MTLPEVLQQLRHLPRLPRGSFDEGPNLPLAVLRRADRIGDAAGPSTLLDPEDAPAQVVEGHPASGGDLQGQEGPQGPAGEGTRGWTMGWSRNGTSPRRRRESPPSRTRFRRGGEGVDHLRYPYGKIQEILERPGNGEDGFNPEKAPLCREMTRYVEEVLAALDHLGRRHRLRPVHGAGPRGGRGGVEPLAAGRDALAPRFPWGLPP